MATVDYSIYQLPREHDLAWCGYEYWAMAGKNISLKDYINVYSGTKYVDVYGDSNTLTALTNDILEEIFKDFNIGRPDGYTGRSLSVSDIVGLVINGESQYYYCDHFGWVRI